MHHAIAVPRTPRRVRRTAVLAAMLVATAASCTSPEDEPEDAWTESPDGPTADEDSPEPAPPAADAPSTVTPGEPFTVTAADGWQFIHTAFTVSGQGGEIMVSTSDDGATPQEGHRDLSGSTAEVDALRIEVGPQAALIVPESAVEPGSYQICGSGVLISEDESSSPQQICAETELAD